MATTLNIRNVDTVTYRTDCIAPYSPIKKHYIRNHNVINNSDPYNIRSLYHDGYEKQISDVSVQLPSQSTSLFDIGHNPYTTNPSNPIICDKLLLFASCRDETLNPDLLLCSNVLYNKLKFEKPMLLINGINDISDESRILYRFDRNYYLPDFRYAGCVEIDELDINPNYYNYLTIFGNGKRYDYYGRCEDLINYQLGAFTSLNQVAGDFSDRAGQFDISIDFYDYNQDEPHLDYYLVRKGIKGIVCSYDELRSRFWYTNPRPAALNIMDGYIYGALMIPTYSSPIFIRQYIANQCNYAKILSISKPVGWIGDWHYLFRFLIIPFISQAEYEAAKASIYTWPSYTITTLNNNNIQ